MDLEQIITQTATEDQEKLQAIADAAAPVTNPDEPQIPVEPVELPVNPPDVVDDIVQAVKSELTSDPANRGYGGKSLEEATELLNASYEAEGKIQPPRISVILIGIPYAPNVITPEQLKSIIENK